VRTARHSHPEAHGDRDFSRNESAKTDANPLTTKETRVKRKNKLPRSAVAFLPIVLGLSAAQAVEIDVGNADLAIRWDNTARYNYMLRVESQDPNILNSANSDDGDRNFNKGTVSNRIDLLSELDVVYKKSWGVRISGAGWYDAAARKLDNTSVATSNHLVNGQQALGMSDTAKRYHQGLSGEILDAFVFGRADLGEMPLNFKLGRHTTFWGEALLSPIHSLSYGQAPLDLRKAAAVPGTEAKELFLPRNALSAQLQINPELSLAGQYFLDWAPFRIPEAGSYLGAGDMLQGGGESLILAPGVLFQHGTDVTPKKQGDWGLSARLRPDWLDGTMGLYYRKTADIQFQMHIAPATGQYYLVYPSGIDVVGFSLAKNVAGVSVGAEVNYRKNMPLNSDAAVTMTAPASGQTAGAVGDTWHAVINTLFSMGKTPLFDAASWITELQWNRWAKVRQGADLFKGRDDYTGVDKVTKDFVGLGVSFTPTWYQALPGVDLMLPLFYSVGLSGTSAVSGGGNKSAGNYSFGIGADVYQKYRFDLSYSDTFGPYRVDAASGAISSAANTAMTKDRGFVSLTFKTTF
jgi:hypothetical protein